MTYVGVNARGHLENSQRDGEELLPHQVAEFVTSCRDAGWKSVAVYDGIRSVAFYRQGRPIRFGV